MTEKLFDVSPRHESFFGVQEFPTTWALRLFSIGLPDACAPDLQVMRRVLGPMVQSIESRMSPEFDYGRFGAAIVHVGRRGICITIMHFGGWGTTFEVFSSSWYRYGQEFDEFELLDDIEPALCWFETERTAHEIEIACSLARSFRLSEIRKRYLAAEIRGPRP